MEWINVKDGLPEQDCTCLVYNTSRPFKYYICGFSYYSKEFEQWEMGHIRLYDPICLSLTHYAIIKMPKDE